MKILINGMLICVAKRYYGHFVAIIDEHYLQLFLLLLLHFPREGIEHRELMALISNRLAVVDYFSPTMWTQHEFETVLFD
jgi:hypothetical protein